MNYNIRGKKFVGIVKSAKAPKTVTVEFERYVLVPKYERYEKRKTKIYAHNEINAKEGDIVLIGETRKISKTKSFVVLKILGHKEKIDIEEIEKEENREKIEEKQLEN